MDVDRCYVCLYSNDENTSMDNTHEWCAKGIEPQIEMLKDVPVEQFPWGMEKLKQLETIHIPRVADLPAYADAEKELLQLQSVQSFVIVPMAYGGTLIGLLGFDSVLSEKQWTEQDVALLKIVGEIFVNALEHKRQQDMLQEAHNQLELRVRERTAELLTMNTLLEQAKEYAENLIETANVMVIGLDLQGTVQVFNKAAEIVTGYKKTLCWEKTVLKSSCLTTSGLTVSSRFPAGVQTGGCKTPTRAPSLRNSAKKVPVVAEQRDN